MKPSTLLSSLAFSCFLASPALATMFEATSTIASNFNGTAIAAGRTLWFNAVCTVTGLGAQPVTVHVDQSTISYSVSGSPVTITVPESDITLTPGGAELATASVTGSGTWLVDSPSGLSGNYFMSGVAVPLPAGLPGGINPVTWSARFSTTASGLTVKWKWAAAVYTTFGGTLASLGVKPVDDNSASSYQNSDHAGTPESYKSFVTGGARGGGGSNFTGSYSGTDSVVLDSPTAVNPSTWGAIKTLFRR